MPEIDEMLTIDPPPAAFITGIANFMPKKTPRALTAISLSHAAVSNKSSTALPLSPASLTRMSSFPNSAIVASTAAFVEHIGDDDLRSFAGKDPRHARTHPGCSSGNQRNLVLEPHHVFSVSRI